MRSVSVFFSKYITKAVCPLIYKISQKAFYCCFLVEISRMYTYRTHFVVRLPDPFTLVSFSLYIDNVGGKSEAIPKSSNM